MCHIFYPILHHVQYHTHHRLLFACVGFVVIWNVFTISSCIVHVVLAPWANSPTYPGNSSNVGPFSITTVARPSMTVNISSCSMSVTVPRVHFHIPRRTCPSSDRMRHDTWGLPCRWSAWDLDSQLTDWQYAHSLYSRDEEGRWCLTRKRQPWWRDDRIIDCTSNVMFGLIRSSTLPQTFFKRFSRRCSLWWRFDGKQTKIHKQRYNSRSFGEMSTLNQSYF